MQRSDKKQLLLRNIRLFFAGLVLCFGAGAAGRVFTEPAVAVWYQGLVKPALSPPDWVFAPVWTLLYFLLAVTFCFIWQAEQRQGYKTVAQVSFLVQILLNVLWSAVFFGQQSPGDGMIVFAVLFPAVFSLLFSAWRVSRKAVWLLLPYLCWLCFAAYLNYQFWLLN